MSQFATLGFLFAVAASTAAIVEIVRRFAWRTGAVDRPGGHKGHDRPVALLGGVAVFLGILVAAAAWAGARLEGPLPPAVLLASTAVALITGVVDDLRGLSPRAKLIGQTAAAALAVVVLGPPDLFGSILVDGAIVIAAIVFLTNAFNLIDNMNGLCAGTGLVLGLALAGGSAIHGPSATATGGLLIAGALAGFLPFNYPWARIFLGDAGSHVTGHALAALVLLGPPANGPIPVILFTAVFFAVPVADVGWVIVRRIREGRPITVGDRGHLSHCLARAGGSDAGAVATMWGATAVCAALAVATAAADPGRIALCCAGAGVVITALILRARTGAGGAR